MYADEMTMCWVLYDGMIYLFMIMKNALAREPIHSLPGRYAFVPYLFMYMRIVTCLLCADLTVS